MNSVSFLDSLATAIFGVGALTPLGSWLLRAAGEPSVADNDVLLMVLICATVAGILHLEATILIGRLE